MMRMKRGANHLRTRGSGGPLPHLRLFRAGCLTLLIAVLLATPGHRAATPGLPFVEDFADTSLRDSGATHASWFQDLRHAERGRRCGSFSPEQFGSDISPDAGLTTATALGDVDGDGDLDLVAVHAEQPNRLYLNNGTADPWSGVTGVDITSDAGFSTSLSLGDVDGDGDLDLVVGIDIAEPNRLYLNNGTGDPWNGVIGINITLDADSTAAVALGDVDGDGDLDLIAGNHRGDRNRLYLNNGTADPWNGVNGLDITTDLNSSSSLALGDVDNDGDLDLVVGNFSNNQPNRLYLNNGTADPWNGVTGTDITANADNTTSVALGDVDGDGDLDLVAGNSLQPSRLYLNSDTLDPWSGKVFDIDSTSSGTQSLVLEDVDGDGDLDLIMGNGGENLLYLNNGTIEPWLKVKRIPISLSANNTTTVSLGGVDGDGDLDVVTGNNGGPNRLYFNDGMPCPWHEVTGFDIGFETANTQSVVLGDLDGDGDLDLVAANFGQVNRWHRNDGSTTPWLNQVGRVISSLEENTGSVAIGDVDGDGDLDLFLGNRDSVNRFRLNNGTSFPFSPPDPSTNFSTSRLDTISIVLGDVDGDGDLDIVESNANDATRLYLNNGTADPWNGVSSTVITTDASIAALEDVDSDGDLDLVVWRRLYLNNGTADPWNGVAGRMIAIHFVADFTLGDVDRDGDLDLVTASPGGPNLLYLNNGTEDPWGGVAAREITSDSDSTFKVALADVDGDGHLDLVAANRLQRNRLYINNGTADPWAGVQGVDIATDADSSVALAIGDVDADGDLDLVSGNNVLQLNRLYLNNLNNVSREPWKSVTGADITADQLNTRAMDLGDVDGDGDLDLIAGMSSSSNRLYLNNHTIEPWLGEIGVNITADIRASESLVLGDVDGDGDLDLVVGNRNQPNRLYLNNGTTEPWNGVTGTDITADAHDTYAVELADADGDGDLDLVAGNRDQPNQLYLNNGTADPWGGVAGVDITADQDATESVALQDLDGDGDLDLVAGNSNFQPNRLYLNNGTEDPWGGVTGSDITADGHNTRDIVLGDVDRDGDIDLVAGNSGAVNRLYLSNGTADPWNGITGIDITSDSHTTISVALGDIDRDGDLDLVAGNLGQPNRLYLNSGGANPWPGGTAIFLSPDANATLAVAMADVDGDGVLDVLEGNSNQPNRLYHRLLYDTSRGLATSLEIDTESETITNATLTPKLTLMPNTEVSFWLSNDGGLRWFLVRPGERFLIPNQGNDLRWRAELRSLSPVFSPRIRSLQIIVDPIPARIGDRVWEDLDGDGIQDTGEPGIVAALVYLFDTGGNILDFAFTDANGNYSFPNATWTDEFFLRFIPPTGYVVAPPDQGGDDGLDSDADPTTGSTAVFQLFGVDHHTRWDAGMVPTIACMPPDEPIYVFLMTLSTDGNDFPILHFMDPNQPTQITGYNVYRSDDPLLVFDPSSLFASDIIDMDEATPNKQWVDTSGDAPPGGTWYYQVTAYNHRCPAQTAEGPF